MAASPWQGPVYVGCATDSKFVMPTCAMLSSLEEIGDLPDCIILVAAFGLDEEDRTRLRDSAGRLGERMRFVPIDRDSPKIVALPAFPFPLPLVGRLILPGEIDEQGARLLLIDSDMVINASLRPLADMDLKGQVLAAAQDYLFAIEYHHHGAKRGAPYFNAGLMLVDVERFTAMSAGQKAMHRLAQSEPRLPYLDQCALNEVLDGRWIDLDRRWNFFQTGQDREFSREDFEAASIIHFAGPKPWDGHAHPAGAIWNHHASSAERKIGAWRARINRQPIDRSFVAMQYRTLLGRELEDEAIATEREMLTAYDTTANLIASEEFRRSVLDPICSGGSLPTNRFVYPLTQVDRLWTLEKVPMLPVTGERVRAAGSWRDMFSALVRDSRFMRCANLAPAPTAPTDPQGLQIGRRLARRLWA